MSLRPNEKPEDPGLGGIHEGRKAKIPDDRLLRQTNRGEPTHTKPVTVQSHAVTPPPVTQRVKRLRISHLNCNKSRTALNELTMVRSRDDILLITEPPLADGNPPDLKGYTTISPTSNPDNRTTVYIKDRQMIYTHDHEATPSMTTIRINKRIIKCIYASPSKKFPDSVTAPMEIGEIRMGDFNAAHPAWMDGDTLTQKGDALHAWSIKEGATERGPREPTHDKGHKLDLIFTKDGTDPNMTTKIFNNGKIEHSDHRCQSVSIKTPYLTDEGETKANYRKMTIPGLIETIKAMNLRTPQDAEELINQLEEICKTIPQTEIKDRPRLPIDVLEKRRTLNKCLRRKRAGKLEIRDHRLAYRKSIRDHRNDVIETILEESNDNDKFFELSKRGIQKKAIPPLTTGNQTYRTHREICQAMAEHHGAGDETVENTDTTNDSIEEVTPGEITRSIDKAPTSSTIGSDDIGIKLLNSYHRANPGHLEYIFTEILRKGKHPAEWKKATVVPIPKANKTTYSHPKSWRSIHLLSLVSKTLERIVLGRLQDYGDRNDTLNPTQFGSRRHTGTSDAYQLFDEWRKQAEGEGMRTMCILADVEGGFDKVNPDHFRNAKTDIDPKCNKWIFNWTQNRRIKFRFNGKTGEKEYVTNRGLPQGSPLSPYLFGAYVKKIVSEDFIQNVLIISYVDDLLICIKGKDEKELEEITRAAWKAVKERAEGHGMTFSDNKTKTFHCNSTTAKWKIGALTTELRFLGYWTTSSDSSSYAKHINHWLTKANYTYNVIRALTQRSDSGRQGLNMLSTIRLIHSVTRTIAWYGIEHYGNVEERTKEVDSFMFETIKRLLDMPNNTSH